MSIDQKYNFNKSNNNFHNKNYSEKKSELEKVKDYTKKLFIPKYNLVPNLEKEKFYDKFIKKNNNNTKIKKYDSKIILHENAEKPGSFKGRFFKKYSFLSLNNQVKNVHFLENTNDLDLYNCKSANDIKIKNKMENMINNSVKNIHIGENLENSKNSEFISNFFYVQNKNILVEETNSQRESSNSFYNINKNRRFKKIMNNSANKENDMENIDIERYENLKKFNFNKDIKNQNYFLIKKMNLNEQIELENLNENQIPEEIKLILEKKIFGKENIK